MNSLFIISNVTVTIHATFCILNFKKISSLIISRVKLVNKNFARLLCKSSSNYGTSSTDGTLNSCQIDRFLRETVIR